MSAAVGIAARLPAATGHRGSVSLKQLWWVLCQACALVPVTTVPLRAVGVWGLT